MKLIRRYKEWLFWRTIEDIPLITLADYVEHRGNKIRFTEMYKDITDKMLKLYAKENKL